ncbi:hypothetical protein ACFY0B_33665 [Streptomyces sp. NPDC001797]|uniref:Uncharacterized protein n=1 Tax=Streptomyces sp. 900105755 TaxID=3154389 RepID=A0ABV1TP94_9ACTN
MPTRPTSGAGAPTWSGRNSRTVLWHAEDRVVRHGHHTIVFA